MNTAFVLVHSPSVGPLTWAPIARRLHRSGAVAIVPSLVGVADAGPPFWPFVAEKVRDTVDRLPPEQVSPVADNLTKEAQALLDLAATMKPKATNDGGSE